MENQISSLQEVLEQLNRKYKENILSNSNLIDRMKNEIVMAMSQKKLLLRKIEYYEEEKKDLALQIKDVDKRYNLLVDTRSKASGGVEKDMDAVGLMLYSSELQHTQAYLTQLRENLFFRIPEKISETENRIESVDVNLQKIEADIKLQKERNNQLEPEYNDKKSTLNRQIESIKMDILSVDKGIADIKAKIRDMVQTKSLMDLQVSENPVSPNVKMIMALGAVAGLFFSVFAAFLLEFWKNNSKKILESSNELK